MTATVTLYRPVGDREFGHIRDSGWRLFPPRFDGYPLFCALLDENYATESARDWTTKNGARVHVLRFDVGQEFISGCHIRPAESSNYRQYLIPSTELADLNAHLIGPIEVIASFGQASEETEDLITGSRGAYRWLVTDLDMHEFLRLCPQVALGYFAAVTANDSGAMTLTPQEMDEGWTSSGGIAYSPRLQHLNNLPHKVCDYFDEWYLFATPTPSLGIVIDRNIFESPPEAGEIYRFVNFIGFSLAYDDDDDAIGKLFWPQVDRIQPESYIADGSVELSFATRNKELFQSICAALKSQA